jgi:N-acylglucosamine-6-phosphate 2-epimerase
MCTA